MKQPFALAICASLTLLIGCAADTSFARDLPRRASLGLGLAGGAQGQSGPVVVDQVFPGQTAERMRLEKGDIILEVGGKPVAASSDVIAYAATLSHGDPVDIRIRRKGKELRLNGKALGRPFETYSGATVDYGAVPFKEGSLRDIFVVPRGAAAPPVLFLLPGFTCGSIESPNPDDTYRQIGAAMVREGIGYYRVEKPGVGDSVGGPRCLDIDFATELDAFRSAYRHLTEVRGVNPDRIFLFGHSLGGLQAPLLAAERAPRGVAVFGTVLRNWGDYHQNVRTFQPFIFAGADPVETAAAAALIREVIERYYFDRQSPAAIAAEKPSLQPALREVLGWNDKESIIAGRHYKFMQDLAHLPLYAAWRDTQSSVLSMYGEADLVALFDVDHRLIADIANHYRPGTGRYVEIAATDHGMRLTGDRFEFREKTKKAGSPPDGPFNIEVGRTLAAWIREVMATPPARSAASAMKPESSGG